MKLTAHLSEITIMEPVVILHEDDCLKLGVDPTDRVRIVGNPSAISTVVVTKLEAMKGSVYIPRYLMARCSIKEGDEVEVTYSPLPESIRSIRKKIHGLKLSAEEIDSIVRDIHAGNLSDKEILAFISAFNVNNADVGEIADLTRSMAATGKTVDLGIEPIFDFHSLGGVPGNKITPIVVSIVASEGLIIPKMSSRAISSACGTADFVDTFCDVEMDGSALKDAVAKTGGVFACGNDDYAPVGRRIIKCQRPMGIDPLPVMMASIMSKKIAVGTTHLLIDIPLGDGTKTPTHQSAHDFAETITKLGDRLGIRIMCALTRAEQPIGRTIGPVLEARECIEVLEGKESDPGLIDKACSVAGILLEMAGKTGGKQRAEEILRSGRAHRKFLEIVEVQNGSPFLRSEDLEPGRYSKDIHAKRAGYVGFIDNRSLVAIAKATGAPGDVLGGIELLHKVGDRVDEGEVLFRIYAGNQAKLDRAVDSARSRRPMAVVPEPPQGSQYGMVIETIPGECVAGPKARD